MWRQFYLLNSKRTVLSLWKKKNNKLGVPTTGGAIFQEPLDELFHLSAYTAQYFRSSRGDVVYHFPLEISFEK